MQTCTGPIMYDRQRRGERGEGKNVARNRGKGSYFVYKRKGGGGRGKCRKLMLAEMRKNNSLCVLKIKTEGTETKNRQRKQSPSV